MEAPGDGEGQGNLACCGSWGRRELDMTERLNNKYVESKNMTQMNLSTIEKETHGQTEQTRGGEGEWEAGVSRCKLLYMEWINIILLDSTENY